MSTVRLRTALALAIAFAAGWLIGVSPDSKTEESADLPDAIEEALADGDRLERLGRLASLLKSMEPSHVDRILAIVEGDLAGLGECEIRLFVDAWSRIDAERALQETLEWKIAPKYRAGVEAAVNGWALRDPQEARSAVEELSARRPRLAPVLRQALVTGWALSDEDRAGLVEYLREAPDQSDALLSAALGATYRTKGPEFVLVWSEDLGKGADPELRAKIIRKALRVVARRDPERAARWVIERIGDDLRAEASRVVAEAWLERDPIAAFKWLESSIPATDRDRAVGQTFGRWLFFDRPAAIEWLSSVDRTAFHDPALQTLARQLMRRQVEDGIEWCRKVRSGPARQDCLAMLARHWLDTEPARARIWIDGSELEPGRRASLLGDALRRETADDEKPVQSGSHAGA